MTKTGFPVLSKCHSGRYLFKKLRRSEEWGRWQLWELDILTNHKSKTLKFFDRARFTVFQFLLTRISILNSRASSCSLTSSDQRY